MAENIAGALRPVMEYATGSAIAVTVSATWLLTYVLLQKKVLPQCLWLRLSRIFFPPMVLPVYLCRRLRGRPYWCLVDQGVLLGSVPLVLAGHVHKLHRMGVRAVVNLQDEYAGPIARYASLVPPIEQLYLPTIDHVEPTVADLETAVQFIAEQRAKGAGVYIHCKGGHGRSAAVAAAWLLSKHGGSLSPERAQKHLDSVGHVRRKLLQQPAVQEFHRRHCSKATNGCRTYQGTTY